MKELNITVENGVSTVEVLTGQALERKEPRVISISGILNSPLKWLEKRVDIIQQEESHIRVDREKMSITLVTNESNHYATTICGKMELHPAFIKFGINSGNYRSSLEMAELVKMNRSYFDNRQYAMELVTILRQFKAKINKEVEAEHNPNKGDKRVLFAQKVESNLYDSFQVNIPIFKGTSKVEIECEVYFNPDDLTCTLVSAGANETIEDQRDGSIDSILAEIREIAPNIAIIEE